MTRADPHPWMLDHLAIVCPWDELADRLVARYGGTTARVVMYLGEDSIERDPRSLGRWGEVARALGAA